jgi:hypothetical protein
VRGSFKQSMGARNRAGLGLSYQPARLHRLTEMILWKFQEINSVGVDSRAPKSFKIRTLYATYIFEASWVENDAKQIDQYGKMSYGGKIHPQILSKKL